MRVVVTRPAHESLRWVQALGRAHIDAVALPLILTLPADDVAQVQAAWRRLAQYDAVMFVSAAAADHFFGARPAGEEPVKGWPDRPLPRAWAPGPGTALALQRQGVPPHRIDTPDPHAGQFDSEALWRRLGASVAALSRVLVVRGADSAGATLEAGGRSAEPGQGQGRDWLAQRLRDHAVQVDFVVAYRRAAPTAAQLQAALRQPDVAGAGLWLFTSAQAIRNLADALPQQDWSGRRALVTHPRIAQAARRAGFVVAGVTRPALVDVVASIKSIQ